MRHYSGVRMWSVSMDLVSNFPAEVIDIAAQLRYGDTSRACATRSSQCRFRGKRAIDVADGAHAAFPVTFSASQLHERGSV
jgi:hypothetical protein